MELCPWNRFWHWHLLDFLLSAQSQVWRSHTVALFRDIMRKTAALVTSNATREKMLDPLTRNFEPPHIDL